MTIGRLLAIGIALSGAAGSTVAHAQVIQGFGKDIAFATAARQIVPSGMRVDVDSTLRDRTVSWSGGADWHSVLDQLASSRNAVVSYEGQTVRIAPVGVGNAGAYADRQVPAMPSLNRAGLVVLADQPPAAPIVLQPTSPIAAQPAVPIVLQPTAAARPPVAPVQVVPVAVVPVPAPVVVAPRAAPIVLQPRVASPPPAAVVVVPAPATVVVEPAAPVETARQKQERLRAERAAERAETIVSPRTSSGRSASGRAVSTVGTWRAVRGESLDQVLGDWADKAGWTLVFNSQVIYDIQAGAEFNGEFTESVASLIRSVHARPVPTVIFYRGNKTLVVSNNVDGN